jgi:hypothetical protein
MKSAPTPITATIPRMAELADVGISKIQDLLRKGQLKTITLGARRLIVVDSYRQLIEAELAGPPKDARRNGAVPALGTRVKATVLPLDPPVKATVLPLNPLDVRVDTLNLSTRAHNALHCDGLAVVGDLVERTPAELLQIPNFGRRCLGEVEAALAKLQLHLRRKESAAA